MADKETVRQFLKTNPFGVISTVSDKREPWGSSIFFAVDKELNFYFITRADTQKYKNVEKTNRASITVTDIKSQITVQASGDVHKVPAKDLMDVLTNKIKYTKSFGNTKWAPPIVKIHGGDYMVLKFQTTFLQYANFKQIKSDIREDFIERII